MAPKTRTIGPCSQALAKDQKSKQIKQPAAGSSPASPPAPPSPARQPSTCFRETRWGAHSDSGPRGRGPCRAHLDVGVTVHRSSARSGFHSITSLRLSLRREGSRAPPGKMRPKSSEMYNPIPGGGAAKQVAKAFRNPSLTLAFQELPSSFLFFYPTLLVCSQTGPFFRAGQSTAGQSPRQHLIQTEGPKWYHSPQNYRMTSYSPGLGWPPPNREREGGQATERRTCPQK